MAVRHDIRKDELFKARFWAKVEVGRPAQCWEWKASKTNGYGNFSSGLFPTACAHRIAYTLLVGDIPKGLVIDHLCRNRGCVNPAHLEAVTNRENILRGVGSTAINHRKTHCVNGHAFTEENIYLVKKGRQCHICKNIQAGRSRMKMRALRDTRQALGEDHGG